MLRSKELAHALPMTAAQGTSFSGWQNADVSHYADLAAIAEAVPEPQSRALREFACASGGGVTSDGGAWLARLPGLTVAVVVGTFGGGVFLNPTAVTPVPNQPAISWHTQEWASHSVADIVQWIKYVTGYSAERVGRLLNVSRMTLNLWERGNAISDENRRRMLAVRDVLARALRRHPTQQELVLWLDSPQGTNGHTVSQLLEAGEMARARYLAAASPSQLVAPPPAWSNRPVPERFRVGAERLPKASPLQDDDTIAALRAEAELPDDGELS